MLRPIDEGQPLRPVRPVLSALLLLAAAWSCSTRPERPPGAPLRAVATTSIVADLVREIGGEAVSLSVLMGPGIDPHMYKPSEGDILRLGEADAVFYNGLHLEGRMVEVLERLDRIGVPSLAVAECIPVDRRIVASGFGGVYDPHVWFDVRLWRFAARCTADELRRLLPRRAEEIERRARDYDRRLERLHSWVAERLAAVPPRRRILITAHDAFSYFGRAYHVEVRGLLGLNTAAEAGAADVAALAELIATRKIPAVFVESSVPRRYVRALIEAASARGARVRIGGTLYSDALGDPGSPAGTYEGMVRSNVETLVAGLVGDGDAPARR
ncbi:MAG: manganese transporter [Acidobacteria bacterium]|nr:MAG: manganese transporter [Acidobacteriota bacterium]